jgi:hypothetical protein
VNLLCFLLSLEFLKCQAGILAVQLQEGSSSGETAPPVVSPAPEFLGDCFLGHAVWRRLKPDGMLMINALGSEEYLREVEEVLTR